MDSVPIDVIRIDQAASMAPFSIKALSYVNVTVVDKSSVVLDLVELLFKEQYLNGNDMLRIKTYLENSCVYMKKSIEFCGMRCTVREMWARNADCVTCGYISDRTRVGKSFLNIYVLEFRLFFYIIIFISSEKKIRKKYLSFFTIF